MDRKKSNQRRRQNIRLLAIAVFLFFYKHTYPTPLESSPIIKMEYSPSNPSIQDIFKLKFTIQKKENVLHKDSFTSPPMVLLNDVNEFLKFAQSRVYDDGENTILETQYQINRSGTLKLDNIFLIIGKHKILQPKIELYIESPELSKKTQFRTRLFNKKNAYENTDTVFIGEEYLVVIEGNFKKNDKQKVGIECSKENNTLIEKNNRNLDCLNLNDGWHILSAFLWYPLHTGMVKLPEILISITTENENYNFKLDNKILIVVKENADKEISKNIEKETFQQKLKSSINDSIKSKLELSKRAKIAYNIRELRNKECTSFFYWKLKSKRVLLEQELGLENTFPVFNYPLFFLLLLFSVILTFTLTLLLLIKKIRLNFLTAFMLFSAIGMLLYDILQADFREEYTCQDIKNDNNVYLAPERHSSQIDSIELGETVKIMYTINGYKYIEKYNNSSGWIK